MTDDTTKNAYRYETCANCSKHAITDGKPDTVALCLLPPQVIAIPRPHKIVDQRTFQAQIVPDWRVETHYRMTQNQTPACTEFDRLGTVQ